MRKKISVVVVLIAVLIISCTKETGQGARPRQQEQKTGSYVARVGNTLITETDVEKELKALPEQIREVFEGEEGRRRFIDELVKKEILYQEARKRGLENSPEFKEKLDGFKKITLVSLLLEREIEEKVKVGDSDAKAYYDSHRNEFITNTQIRASHILVKNEKEANNILTEIQNGSDFAKLAKSRSIDKGSARNGGDLGYFSRGQMVSEFENVAFNLKIGEVSKPVKTQYGYHIIKVTDKKEGKPVEFEKVKDMIIQRLTAERQKALFDSFIDELRKKYEVEIKQ